MLVSTSSLPDCGIWSYVPSLLGSSTATVTYLPLALFNTHDLSTILCLAYTFDQSDVFALLPVESDDNCEEV